MSATTIKSRFQVEGMDCAACAAKIDTAVRRMPGVDDVWVSSTAGTMSIDHKSAIDLDALAKMITGLGYGIAPVADGRMSSSRNHGDTHSDKDVHDHGSSIADNHDHSPTSQPWWKTRKGLLTIACGVALAAAYGIGKLVPSIAPWAFVVAMLVGLIPIGRRAVAASLAGSPFTIESLMTIAAIGAVIIGAGEEGAAVVFLFLVGELLEGVAAGKARASIKSLTKLVPATALVEKDGQTQEIAADKVQVGAIVLVRPGDRIAADGVIVAGESSIDEASITGESIPVRKGVDATVFAGSVNGDAVLRIRVTAAAADNTIARVVRLVEEAQESKAPTERFIDRFSRFYTPAVVIVAALVAILPPLAFGGTWAEWIYKGLAILLIGCPCALVISTPAAIAASLSAGARRGLLLKGGAVLEGLGKVTAVCFDKTGTLTSGKPKVTEVLAFGMPQSDVLRLAAALETGSSHPLAAAILTRAAEDQLSIPSATRAQAHGGKGVSAVVEGKSIYLGSPSAVAERVALTSDQTSQIHVFNGDGKTVSVLLVDDSVVGVIAMRDEPRPDAKAGLKALAEAGVKTLMLTGDNQRTAESIGRKLGIEARAGLLPQDKQRIVSELKSEGMIVAKVGDGINDAPALAAADIGIAMGGGTDVALETADAAVLHGRVGDVAAMIALSKSTMSNIHQNITIALGLKAVFLVTTVLGVTGLWPAILADTGATVIVTLNALRILNPTRASAA